MRNRCNSPNSGCQLRHPPSQGPFALKWQRANSEPRNASWRTFCAMGAVASTLPATSIRESASR